MDSLDSSNKKSNSGIVGTSRHKPKFDTASINRALERAMNDERFLNDTLESIETMNFPAYKNDIVQYLKNKTADQDIISLFESLDGYIQFNDLSHVKKSIEQNIPEKKLENQISDQTRRNPNVRIRETRLDKSTKETEAVSPSEERKDYPEVTPTGMTIFKCDLCGKHFQNQDDLIHHQRFERG
jgi:hypothetical protein